MGVNDMVRPATTGLTASSDAATPSWLEGKRQDAGVFFVLIAALTLWTTGFIDLVTHTSQPATLLGRYSVPYAMFLLAYGTGFVLWLGLILRADGSARFKRVIAIFQARWWAGVLALLAFSALFASMFITQRWAIVPLFEVSMLLLGLLLVATLVLARPVPQVRMQPWRKVVLVAAGGLIAIEVLLQAAAAAGVLPFDNMSGAHTAYGRIYQTQEGRSDGMTNRYGWYYPDPQVGPGKVVLLTGDSFIQGLQVRQDQNVGMALQRRIREQGNGSVQSLGFPGYTAALYTDPMLAPFSMLAFNPNEVVLFFHLADDVQAVDAPTGELPFYDIAADGSLVRREEDAHLRHSLQHLIIRAYDPVNPVQSLQSHLFLPQLIKRAAGRNYVYQAYGDQGVPPVVARNTDFSSAAQPFGRASFLFERAGNPRADHALKITEQQLKALKAELDTLGIGLKIVTIPYLPPAFFEQRGADWSSSLGAYDALLPEQRLGKIATSLGIPFLPMGEYMKATGTSTEDIRALYFNEGKGHFTPTGHDYFAQAVFACFFDTAGACPVQPQ